MKKLFTSNARFNQAGDTIVEVLISVATLALVLVVAYQSTSRSLQNGIDSSNRQQALALAEQQVETIKNAAATKQAALDSYQSGAGAFCIDSTQAGVSPSYGKGGVCNSVNGLYTISDTYSGGVFTVVASWPSTVSGSSGKSQLTLYYR